MMYYCTTLRLLVISYTTHAPGTGKDQKIVLFLFSGMKSSLMFIRSQYYSDFKINQVSRLNRSNDISKLFRPSNQCRSNA